MFRLLFLATIALCAISCQSQDKLLPPTAFSSHLEEQKTKNVIDVRTPDEYHQGYILGAKNIDWNGANFDSELDKLDKSIPLYLYCLSGGRSGNAMKKAREMGFKNIIGLEGGIMAWRAEKLPLASLNGSKLSGMSIADYKALYTDKSKKILIDFYAEWCIPCQKMKPFLKKIESKLKDKVEVIRINADENSELCQSLGVNGLPYILIYENNQIEWKKLGYTSEEELLKILNK